MESHFRKTLPRPLNKACLWMKAFFVSSRRALGGMKNNLSLESCVGFVSLGRCDTDFFFCLVDFSCFSVVRGKSWPQKALRVNVTIFELRKNPFPYEKPCFIANNIKVD